MQKYATTEEAHLRGLNRAPNRSHNDRSLCTEELESRAPGKALRVVHIIKHCGHANGSVHVAVDLACMQSHVGYDVTFVSGGGIFEPLLTQYGVRHVNLPHDQRSPIAMLHTAWKLGRMARRIRPDVMHAHMMSSTLVGYAASKLSGVPLITTVHNSFDWHSFVMRMGHKVVAVSNVERDHLQSQGYSTDQLCTVMNAPNKSPREDFMQDAKELTIRTRA